MEEKNKLEILMQSKNLVETSYNVTAIQNRIFYYCLYSAQKEKTGELCCTVKLADLKKLIPNRNQSTLANIKKTFTTLKNSALLFDKQIEGDLIECDYNLIAGSEYNTNKQEFKIYFMQRLYSHILQYSNYAPLNIDILSKFTSFYAQRLYEALRMWSRTEKRVQHTFNIDDLRFILGVKDKYPEYKNFKQRALNQAIKEINSMGNMEVELRELKEGRKVTKVEFIIFDHEPKVYFKNNKNIPFVEVPTVLKDGAGEDVEVMQQAINIDAVEDENKIAPAGATAEANKFVCLPDNILSPEASQDFINYCYKENYSFTDRDFNRILLETQEATKGKKGMNEGELIDNKLNNSYSLFKKIFINKITQHERTETVDIIPQYTAPADATASEEGQGVELPSWIQNLNNYDK